MAVINECEEKDPMYFIGACTLCEYGKEFDWDIAVDFEVGDKVYFVDYYKDKKTPESQEHLSWMVIFETNEGKRFSATQLYFVTEDEWEEICDFFKGKGLK